MTSSVYKSLPAKSRKGRYPRAPKEERTLDGIVFDSKGEMTRWATLLQWQRAGEIRDLRRQKSYAVEIKGHKFCSFKPDFEYITKEGRIVIEDFKSTGTAKERDYKLRKKAFELYYGLEVTEVISS